MLSRKQREVFDDLLDEVVAELPPQLHDLMEEVPLIVEDEPSPRMIQELGLEPDRTLLGLHWGVALPNRLAGVGGTETPWPDRMMLFRQPIMAAVGYRPGAVFQGRALRELRRQIRITLLHEIGHHFGMDEDDLAQMGYG